MRSRRRSAAHGLRAALRAVLDRRPQVTKRRAVLRRLIDGRGLVARSDAPARRPGVELAVAKKGRDRETRQAPPSDASGRHVLDAARVELTRTMRSTPTAASP